MNNIDKIGRSALEGYSEGPPPLVFKSVRKKVLWFSLWNLGLLRIIRIWWPAVVVPMVVLISLQLADTNSKNQSGKQLADSPKINLIGTLQNRSTLALTSKIAVVYPQQNTHRPSASINHPNTTQNNNVSPSLSSPTAGSNSNNNNAQTNNTTTENNTLMANTPLTQSTNAASTNPIDLSIEQQAIATVPLRVLENSWIEDTYTMNVAPNTTWRLSDGLVNYRRQASVSLIAGFGLSQSLFGKDLNEQPARQQIKPSIMNFQLLSEVEMGHFWLSSGIQYTRLDANWSMDEILFNEQLINTPILISQNITYDSIGYWHYTYTSDSMIHVSDSVWAYNIDSTVINNYDTVQTNTYDTLSGAKAGIRISSFELPLVVGVRKQIGSFDVRLGAGFIIGRQLSISGNTIGSNQSETGLVNARDYFIQKQWTTSWMLTAHIRKSISERISLGLNPYYRNNFSGLGKLDGGKSSGSSAFGINFTLNYNLF